LDTVPGAVNTAGIMASLATGVSVTSAGRAVRARSYVMMLTSVVHGGTSWWL
jgi:hypothetical protein